MWCQLLLVVLALLLLNVEGGFVNNRGGRDGQKRRGRVKGIDAEDVDFSDFQVRGNQNKPVKVKGRGAGQKQVNKRKLNQFYKNVPIYGASIVVEYEEDDKDESDPFVDFGVYYERGYIAQYIDSVRTGLDDADLREIIAADLGRDDFESTCDAWIYFVDLDTVLVPYHAFICGVIGQGGGGAAIIPGGDEPDASVYHWQYVIDAKQGTILVKVNVMNSAAAGDLMGNDRMGTEQFSRDTTAYPQLQTANVVVETCGGGTDVCTPLSCESALDCEPAAQDINGGHGIAMMAFAYSAGTFDCYRALTHGGLEPVTHQVPVRVHYGTSFSGAFWDGNAITFGDGGLTYYPLVSAADIVAHELGHGFTQRYSGLVYWGQSGAVHEAYADLAGVTCAAWIKGRSVDWAVGADIFKEAGKALRYMNNPPLDGHESIGHYSDYHAWLDVHQSSGVFNKAFYNMVQGGLSIQDVFKVASFANQLYWTSSSSMSQAAQGMMHAADDLEVNSVTIESAFAAVGINNLVSGGGENPTNLASKLDVFSVSNIVLAADNCITGDALSVWDNLYIVFDLKMNTWNTGGYTHMFDFGDSSIFVRYSLSKSQMYLGLESQRFYVANRLFSDVDAQDLEKVHHEIYITQDSVVWTMDDVTVLTEPAAAHAFFADQTLCFPKLTNGDSTTVDGGISNFAVMSSTADIGDFVSVTVPQIALTADNCLADTISVRGNLFIAFDLSVDSFDAGGYLHMLDIWASDINSPYIFVRYSNGLDQMYLGIEAQRFIASSPTFTAANNEQAVRHEILITQDAVEWRMDGVIVVDEVAVPHALRADAAVCFPKLTNPDSQQVSGSVVNFAVLSASDTAGG